MKLEHAEFAIVARGEIGLVLGVVCCPVTGYISAFATEGLLDGEGENLVEAHANVMLGDRFRVLTRAQRACSKYARAWLRGAAVPTRVDRDVAVAEATAHAPRVAGRADAIAQA